MWREVGTAQPSNTSLGTWADCSHHLSMQMGPPRPRMVAEVWCNRAQLLVSAFRRTGCDMETHQVNGVNWSASVDQCSASIAQVMEVTSLVTRHSSVNVVSRTSITPVLRSSFQPIDSLHFHSLNFLCCVSLFPSLSLSPSVSLSAF